MKASPVCLLTNRPDAPFELDLKQITQLMRIADFKKGDIFYDLGCGEGKVVIEIAKQPKIKKSIGIEKNLEPYEIARKSAIWDLTKKQQEKAYFMLAEMDTRDEDDHEYFYNITDANVIYFSLEEELENVEWFEKRLGKKRVKIITKDLPMVGYNSKANRCNDDCWLFRMTYPLARIRSKQDWVNTVFGVKSLTMDHVYSYYGGQLSKRKAYKRKDVIETLLAVQTLVNRRF